MTELTIHGQRRRLLCFARHWWGQCGRPLSLSHPGPELDLALEVRKMAVEFVQADARDLKLTLETFGEEMKDVKATITGLVQNPLDVVAQRLLIPAALSIVKGLRSRKAQS